MTNSIVKDYTGYSSASLNEAADKALEQTAQLEAVEIVETRSSQQGEKHTEYQVTVTIRGD